MIEWNVLLAVLDSMAAAVPIFEAAMGLTGAEAGTVSKGADNNINTLTAVNDRTVQDDLVGAFVSRLARVKAGSLYMMLSARDIQRAIDVHTGGLSEFLRAAAGVAGIGGGEPLQVHPDLAKIGFLLDPDVLFSPIIDPMATFVASGPGAGVATIVNEIDISRYGNNRLALRTTSVIGSASIFATVTTMNRQGGSAPQLVLIAANTANNARFALSTHGVKVTGISITGGTAGDQFKIVSEIERTMVL